MKKVFFFDIDDTLLPTGGDGMSKENIKAIKKLDQNYDVYIATGKSLDMAKGVLKELGVSKSITSNGSVIFEDGKIIYSRHLEDNHIDEIKDIIKDRPKTILGGQGNNNAYVITQDEDIYQDHVVSIFGRLSVDIPTRVDDFEEKVYQLWLLGDVDNIDIDEDKFDSFRWHTNGLDVVYKNTSKAQAIKFLLDNKYVGEEVEVYAFGDSLNDIQMFKLADVGVAMSNARDELKAISSTIADNSKNMGVYNYLKENELI